MFMTGCVNLFVFEIHQYETTDCMNYKLLNKKTQQDQAPHIMRLVVFQNYINGTFI